MKLMKSFAIGIGVLVASTLSAMAAPITGEIGMANTFRAENAAGTNVKLSLAVGIDFTPQQNGPTKPANTGSFIVTQGTGSLSIFTPASLGTIRDLKFLPFSAINDFYHITAAGQTLSFDLLTLLIDIQTDRTIGLTGHGIMHLTGYDATPGTWSGSFNTAGSALTGSFTWSADSVGAPIPEPMSLALFGAGLLGLGVARRRCMPV